MAGPYTGEMRMFAGNFAPADWALCNGQLLSIADNTELFDLIGTTYGGDGATTFALPDLRGRLPLHAGRAQTGTAYTLGQSLGVETVTLTPSQLPPHIHAVLAATGAAGQTSPAGAVPATAPAESRVYQPTSSPPQAMNASALAPSGAGQPHDNLMPYLCISFIICLVGAFPV
jgi:microcystin-dependent protein